MRAKRKGDNFERQVAGLLADHLGLEIQRVLLSGQRGEGDIEGIPAVHIECKRQEQTRLSQWFEKEQPKANGKQLAIFHKKSREPIMVTMLFKDWIELFREMLKGRSTGSLRRN
jgi:Holliday junction resolvase